MKKTKIICTMGPGSNDKEVMRALIKSGMDIARFNFSHGSHEEHKGRMLRSSLNFGHKNTPFRTRTKFPKTKIRKDKTISKIVFYLSFVLPVARGMNSHSCTAKGRSPGLSL